MPLPPCSCVSELFLMILKGTEEEQAQQLDNTASTSSEATAEVAGCISLRQKPNALLGGHLGMTPGSSFDGISHLVSAL